MKFAIYLVGCIFGMGSQMTCYGSTLLKNINMPKEHLFWWIKKIKD